MTKFLYVLVAILSALVTVWCSLSWNYCIAVFLGLSLLLLLEIGGGLRRVRQGGKWSYHNDFTLKKTHKGNNSTLDQGDKSNHKGPSYLKRKNSVNRTKNHNNQSVGSDSDEEIPGSVSTNSRRTTTTARSIMSGLERSISNSRLLSLFSVFNKTSNGEDDRQVSPPGRCNITGDRSKNGRQALRGNRSRRMAVGGTASHMSPSTSSPSGSRISRLDNTGIMGSPLSSRGLGRIDMGYETNRTVRKGGHASPYAHQRQGMFSSPAQSSPLSNSPLPRFHRTSCESPDRPGINPVGFTPHTLQRPEVCYPSNSSPGRLPHVRLEKRIKIPLVESNVNKMRSPVTVRIAPPETGVQYSPKFTSLRQDLDFQLTPDTSDVLLALREGTRKRTNMAGSDDDSIFESANNNTAKRRRQESNHSTASSSSMPSLPDFLPDLSLCNFTPSSYMSPASRYMVTSSTASAGGPVTNPSLGVIAGSSGISAGIKRPVAPCAHLSPAETSPNSKKPRQQTRNNPILSSLSSSRRYRLQQKESVKRKQPNSTEITDTVASKENQDTLSSDNQQPASKSSKLNPSETETANTDADPVQTAVSTTATDRQSEEAQASTSSGESKTPDLRSRRKQLSFASPSINLNKLSYANVYATKQDYENDRKAEQERVEKMLDRIATENKAPDADILSEKNVVGSSEVTSPTTSALTVPSTTSSSITKALTSTTTATSLKVSSTTASLTSTSSLPAQAADAETSSTPASTSTPAVSSAASTATAAATTNTLSSLLQSSTSTSTLGTPSSTTSSITVPQTTTDLPSTSTKPPATTTSPLTSPAPALASGTAFQPTFGSPATTSAPNPSTGGFQFDIKSSLAPSSAIPSTTSESVVTGVTASGFGLGTTSTAAAAASPASTPSTFAFGATPASPATSAFTTGAVTTTTNAGLQQFSSPSKDPLKPGGFSFALVNPQATPTSSATPKTDIQVSSPFSTPKTQISSTSSPSSFTLPALSAQAAPTSTTISSNLTFGAAAAPGTSPATGAFSFGKSATPTSLPQSTTPATSNAPTTGMFAFNPNEAATLKTSSASVPTSNPTGMFTFKGAADSTSAVTNPASSGAGFGFGTSATSTSLPSFGSSSKAPPAYGATTAGNTFAAAAASPKFGASSTPTFGATSTTSAATRPFGAATPAFGATSTTSAPTRPFGAATPAFGAATSAFGATSTTSAPKPAFGATTPAFGATSTTSATTPAFGATTPTFGATSTTSAPTPAFGASTLAFGGSTPAFGATSSTGATTPAFGATSSASTPVFGATSSTSAASPRFGSTTKPSPAFGATATPFGASPTVSTAFGGSTTAFGTPSSTSTMFGASNTQSTQANTSSTGSFPFQSNSTAQQTSATSPPSAGFNFAFNTSQNPFNFGGGGTTSTTTATATTTTSTAAAGSTSIFGQASGSFGGFSSAGQDGQKPMFGSPSTNQSSGFNFGGSTTNQASNVFGQTGQQPQATSIFQNSEQQQASQPFGFGQGTTAGNPSTPFGQSSAFSSSQQASSFGSFGAAKPNVFGTPTNNSDKPSQPAPSIFGSTPTSAAASPNVTAQPKPLFGQVASQSFGGGSTTPANTGNAGVFGSPSAGQTSTPAGGSATPGIFTFGGSSGAQQPAAASPNKGFDFSASVVGSSQFNFGGQGPAAAAPTMFNMGSGSTAPKMRTGFPKARRRGKQK